MLYDGSENGHAEVVEFIKPKKYLPRIMGEYNLTL